MRPETLAMVPGLLHAGLLLAAAVYDAIYRRIPNWTVAALVVLFVGAALLDRAPSPWAWSLAAFAVVLAGSFGLYALGWIGAGDAKLLSAAALFTGLTNLPMFLVATALFGGVMAVGFIAARPRMAMRGLTARGRAENTSRGIPYGVAIAAGAVITSLYTGFLSLS